MMLLNKFYIRASWREKTFPKICIQISILIYIYYCEPSKIVDFSPWGSFFGGVLDILIFGLLKYIFLFAISKVIPACGITKLSFGFSKIQVN